MLLSSRIAVPLVLLGTETGMTDGHVPCVRPGVGVLRGGIVVLCQVVLHHTGVRSIAAKDGIVAFTFELSLSGRLRILHPA